MEHFYEQSTTQNNSFGESKQSLEAWKSVSGSVSDTNTDQSGGFDCNICLDSVQDPVVTLCGHLFCWPCIYQWLNFQTNSSEKQDHKHHQQCPVCKSQVSHSTLVPLYGKGKSSIPSKNKAPNLGVVIPRRPVGPSCGNIETPGSFTNTNTPQIHNPSFSHQPNMFDPMIGVFGEMVYARAFGNEITNLYVYPNSYNLVGSSSPRVRRHIMETDKSLNRICCFLFCCLILCLLSF